MAKYVRLTKGVQDKGQLVPVEKVIDYITDTDQDYYTSLYYYTDEHLKQFKETGSVRGIRDVTTDKLVFDLDDKQNPKNAQTECVQLISRLTKYGVKEKDIEIYFTGNKGFNLVITLNRSLNPDTAYSLAVNKFGKDLKTIDTSVYDASQIIRVPGTKNLKSGLFKIPLSVKQLKNSSIDDIKKLAASIDNITEDFEWDVITPDQSFFDIPKEEKKNTSPPVDLDLSQKPRQWKDYKWALLQGFFNSGERHNALMVIAATCRGLGYDKQLTYYMCKSALKKQAARTKSSEFDKEELWKNIIEESVFSDNWEGGQYSIKTNPWLRSYCDRMGFDTSKEDNNDIVRITDIKDKFADYVKHIKENTITTGIPYLDKAMPVTTGMNLGIVGAASSGKTALALSILKHTSKNDVVSVFASLDMHRNRLFEKLMYKVSNLPREKLYEKFEKNAADDITSILERDYKNVYFFDRSSPTVESIKQYILDVQEKSGKKVKLLMLDYFERVNSEKGEDTAASKDVAGKLQDLVNDLDICVITLVQPNKFSLSGGPDQPIMNYTSIKGSSFLYQSFRSIISLWRPFFNPGWKDHDRFMQMAILKNDLGELDLFNYAWHGRTGEITQLTEEGQRELESLLEEKNSKEKEKEAEWQ